MSFGLSLSHHLPSEPSVPAWFWEVAHPALSSHLESQVVREVACHGVEEGILSQVAWCKPQLCHLLMTWPGARHPFPLGLSFLIWKVGTAALAVPVRVK